MFGFQKTMTGWFQRYGLSIYLTNTIVLIQNTIMVVVQNTLNPGGRHEK